MFDGDLSLDNSKITSIVLITCGFMSVVVSLAQDDIFEIPALDIIQTLICWPSIFESVIISFTLWSLRHIERILGIRSISEFFFINFLISIPTFYFAIFISGFKRHYSIMFFIPYSLFIFMIWRLPAITFHSKPKINDKVLISIIFIFEILWQLPYSILSLIAANIGYMLWSYDKFKFRERRHNINSLI
ncbi:hypothetical protein TRFO_31660 [Tritrichomonas foetus]|uniref:Uncharacterized protein n=1 Tax=Tritrichomonas foetus TaxID=1144522 RepID=A0A1J4JVF9_9EUKA|nr:hypothetical protein TRFO_31660 [Tritrichomonas foetus]|eukprot:OHT01510.1 hypothetical protein TRFO_31660 [Tritrichomonas foetus]